MEMRWLVGGGRRWWEVVGRRCWCWRRFHVSKTNLKGSARRIVSWPEIYDFGEAKGEIAEKIWV
ncbi:hypothetical protein HanRHA438_Chr05g0229681 [Helianthus annuus]|nr:hypothetical protein HanIR_Chr05g0237391 [Helianthus annuus]KAJ0919441.1 hypothetical protein HanRHA438_Chr05g0229681 [Helianthus annuus]